MSKPVFSLVDLQTYSELDIALSDASAFFDSTGDSSVFNQFIARNTRPSSPNLAYYGLMKIASHRGIPFAPTKYQVVLSACYSFMNTCQQKIPEELCNALKELLDISRLYETTNPVTYWHNRHSINISIAIARLNLCLYSRDFEGLSRIAHQSLEALLAIPPDEYNTFSVFNSFGGVARIIAFYVVSVSVLDRRHELIKVALDLLLTFQRVPLVLETSCLPPYTNTVLQEYSAASVIAFMTVRFSRLCRSSRYLSPFHAEGIFVLLSKSIRPEGSNSKNKLLYASIAAYSAHLGLPGIPEGEWPRLADFWDVANGYYEAPWRDAE